eukprot:TRINITY_DN9841_c0_g1_i1.p1 TRINITY_DN9841_c0_g1~~TRINITY_DN9841_c0_g1_i1.p1  ORF type:complete len:234 (-),score=19.29 TRINITY_DN9841_c0_g1_i1:70-771(-)
MASTQPLPNHLSNAFRLAHSDREQDAIEATDILTDLLHEDALELSEAVLQTLALLLKLPISSVQMRCAWVTATLLKQNGETRIPEMLLLRLLAACLSDTVETRSFALSALEECGNPEALVKHNSWEWTENITGQHDIATSCAKIFGQLATNEISAKRLCALPEQTGLSRFCRTTDAELALLAAETCSRLMEWRDPTSIGSFLRHAGSELYKLCTHAQLTVQARFHISLCLTCP